MNHDTYGHGLWSICDRCGAPEFDHRHGCSLNQARVSFLVEHRWLLEKPEYLISLGKQV